MHVTRINPISPIHNFPFSLNIILKRMSTTINNSTKSTTPHADKFSCPFPHSEIIQVNTQANVIFNGVTFINYRFLNALPFLLMPVAPFFEVPTFDLAFLGCFFSWKAPLKSGFSFRICASISRAIC